MVILTGIGGFIGGIKYQQGKVVSGQNFGQRPNGQPSDRVGLNGNQSNRGRTGGGQVIGDILSMDDKSITVKLQDGSSKIVLYSSSTTVSKTTETVITDLKIGSHIGVFGTTNSDGSVTAQNIQLNPILRRNPNNPAPTQ